MSSPTPPQPPEKTEDVPPTYQHFVPPPLHQPTPPSSPSSDKSQSTPPHVSLNVPPQAKVPLLYHNQSSRSPPPPADPHFIPPPPPPPPPPLEKAEDVSPTYQHLAPPLHHHLTPLSAPSSDISQSTPSHVSLTVPPQAQIPPSPLYHKPSSTSHPPPANQHFIPQPPSHQTTQPLPQTVPRSSKATPFSSETQSPPPFQTVPGLSKTTTPSSTETQLPQDCGFGMNPMDDPAEDPMDVDLRVVEQSTYLVDAVDWSTGTLLPSFIIDQGPCSCCWIIAALTCMASIYMIQQAAKGCIVDGHFSAQELVDRLYIRFPHLKGGKQVDGMGCITGFPEDAFLYVATYGVCLEEYWPWIGRRSTIDREKPDDCQVGWIPYPYYKIEDHDEYRVRAKLLSHPIVGGVEIDMARFSKLPKNAIYGYDWLPEEGVKLQRHSIVVVGYGTCQRSQTDYYLIRNSWGPSWCNKGYGCVRRDLVFGFMYPGEVQIRQHRSQ